MAGKPELSAAPGVQNVVVYVSNDNFAQAYAVGGQNAPPYGPPKPYPDNKRPDYPEGYFVSNGYGYEERPKDCDYDPAYVTVMGAEGPPQSVRCDSVRSETAESSCSSLSSADEGMLLVQNQPEMVVYDPSVSVRPGVVFVGAPGPPNAPDIQHHHNVALPPQPPAITVPYGWKRILNNGSIMYIR